jgi:hypothetical protein
MLGLADVCNNNNNNVMVALWFLGPKVLIVR